MKLAGKLIVILTTLFIAFGSQTWAQPASDAQKSAATKAGTPAERPNPDTFPERTFYLDSSDQGDQNEIVSALRNILSPSDKIILIFNQSAVVVRAPAEDMALAQKIIADLDRPRKSYRLTYTLSEMDNDKKVATQHYSMVLAQGQATSIKLGSKLPIVTGSGGNAGVQTQFTYLDVGMSFDATLTGMAGGAMLKSSIEDSSVAPEKTIIGNVEEPVVRQATLKGESFLTPGKPMMLGSLDIPGSTNHLDISVVMEVLP